MTCLWETQRLIIACSPSLAIFQCDCVELIIGNYSKGKESDPTNSLADVLANSWPTVFLASTERNYKILTDALELCWGCIGIVSSIASAYVLADLLPDMLVGSCRFSMFTEIMLCIPGFL